MRIEEEIKQTKFRNEYHKLAVNLIYSYNWFVKMQSGILSKYNITINQFNILRILRGQHPQPVTVNLLRERMLDKMCDASRLVERLRLKGWLDRQASTEDRRRVDVNITEEGLKLLDEIDKENEKQDNLLKTLSLPEVDNLNQLLDKLRG
jgi:DNA-binding MarR family transcriptional regulator